jgi:glutathione S-transferase
MNAPAPRAHLAEQVYAQLKGELHDFRWVPGDRFSEGEIAAAAAAAKAMGQDGKWAITLQNTTRQPALVSLEDRALREHPGFLALGNAAGLLAFWDERGPPDGCTVAAGGGGGARNGRFSRSCSKKN